MSIAAVPQTPIGPGKAVRNRGVLPGFGLSLGYTLTYLSLLVLIPLAGLAIKSADLGWSGFWETISAPRALAAYKLTFGAAFLAAIINGVFGFLVAWTLVRYEFPGRRFLDALIDMPFALPTAVSGIALTAVFAPNGPLGKYLEQWGIQVAYTWVGVVVALTLIGMPFVVRSVQPALLEVQRDLEDAAETLGANRFTIFWRIIVPTTPAGQAAVARRLLDDVRAGRPGIVRVLRFPVMTINHALLVYEATDDGRRMGWASMETRLAFRRLPRAGDRIQSFSAVLAIADKTSHRILWAYDVEREDLLVSFEIVNLAFDIDARAPLRIPDRYRAAESKVLHPELAPRPV